MFELTGLLMSILPTPPSGTPAELAAEGIDFLSLWIGRVGGIIAFIGAIKFALSIKSDEPQEKLQSVLTMVSGFMIVSAVNNLDVFRFGAAGAEAEFDAIMTFIGRWVGIIGGLAVFLGAITFGLAIKDNNATTKITGLKTIAAGAITSSVAVMLPLFV